MVFSYKELSEIIWSSYEEKLARIPEARIGQIVLYNPQSPFYKNSSGHDIVELILNSTLLEMGLEGFSRVTAGSEIESSILEKRPIGSLTLSKIPNIPPQLEGILQDILDIAKRVGSSLYEAIQLTNTAR